MRESVQKTPFAMRINPVLLQRIDAIRPGAGFHSRTDLIETALAAYVEYLEELVEKKIISSHQQGLSSTL